MTLIILIAEYRKPYSTDCGDFMAAIAFDFLIIPGIIAGFMGA